MIYGHFTSCVNTVCTLLDALSHLVTSDKEISLVLIRPGFRVTELPVLVNGVVVHKLSRFASHLFHVSSC